MKIILTKVLGSALLIYALLTVFLYGYQRNMLFVVQAGGMDPAFEQLTLVNGEQRLHGYVLNGGKPEAILYYGGNAEKATDNLHLYNTLFPDITVYVFDYRGYGLSEGHPSQDHLFNDALFIYDHIKTNHQRISLIGRSLGTGVAVYVASQRDIDKLVLLTPYDSITNVAQGRYFMFPVQILLKDPFESWRYAPLVKSETLFLKAETDRIVPHKHTDSLLSYFDPDIVEMATIKDSNHITISDHPDFSARLSHFMADF